MCELDGILTLSWSVGAPTTLESAVNRGSQNMIYDVERGDGNVDVIGSNEKINNYSRHIMYLLLVFVLFDSCLYSSFSSFSIHSISLSRIQP